MTNYFKISCQIAILVSGVIIINGFSISESKADTAETFYRNSMEKQIYEEVFLNQYNIVIADTIEKGSIDSKGIHPVEVLSSLIYVFNRIQEHEASGIAVDFDASSEVIKQTISRLPGGEKVDYLLIPKFTIKASGIGSFELRRIALSKRVSKASSEEKVKIKFLKKNYNPYSIGEQGLIKAFPEFFSSKTQDFYGIQFATHQETLRVTNNPDSNAKDYYFHDPLIDSL